MSRSPSTVESLQTRTERIWRQAGRATIEWTSLQTVPSYSEQGQPIQLRHSSNSAQREEEGEEQEQERAVDDCFCNFCYDLRNEKNQ